MTGIGEKYIRLFRTMFVTGLAFVVNYGINLVLVPYITKHVGSDAYGFVSLSKQFVEYATIITAALNSFAARYIAVEYHRGDIKRANTYISSVFWGNLALGFLVLAGAVICICELDRLLNIPVNIVADVKLLFLFVFINFWFTTVFSVFSSAALVENKLDIAGGFKGASYVTEALVLYVIYVLFPPKVFYVGIGLLSASMVIVLSNRWIWHRYTPELKLTKGLFSIQAVKDLVLAGIWTSINSLGELLNHGLDLIICNVMLSSTAMGQLAIAQTINTMFAALLNLVAQSFQPIFLKSYSRNNRGALLQDLKFSMKISGMFANIGVAGFASVGLIYYKLWIPGQDINLLYKLTVIILLTSIPGGPMKPLYYIYTLTVKQFIPSMVTIIGGLLNVAGMYLLITYCNMGVYAVVWTTAAVMAIINFVTNPLYMAHVLHLPWHTFYPNIIRNVAACGAVAAVYRGFLHIYTPCDWTSLILCVLVYAVTGMLIHLCIVCERQDWQKLGSRMKLYMKKKSD